MGHVSIKTTMDTYGHLIKDINKEAANRLGKSIFKQSGHNWVTKTKKGVMV